jgi:hypothetical protein
MILSIITGQYQPSSTYVILPNLDQPSLRAKMGRTVQREAPERGPVRRVTDRGGSGGFGKRLACNTLDFLGSSGREISRVGCGLALGT